MRGGASVLRCVRRSLLGEIRREPLVEGLDRDVEAHPQCRDELLRRKRLLAAFAPQRQRQPDDDALRLLGAHELREPIEAAVRPRALDDAQRPREYSGRIGDRDSGPRCAEVKGEHFHAPQV